MSTKKKIGNYLDEHRKEMAKREKGYKSMVKEIWLDKCVFVRVRLKDIYIEISLHLSEDNDDEVVNVSALANEYENVWRRFRYNFQKYIMNEKKRGWDDRYIGYLQKLYSSL